MYAVYSPDPWYGVFFGGLIGGLILFAMFTLPLLYLKRKYFIETIALSKKDESRLRSSDFFQYVRDRKINLSDEQMNQLLDFINDNYVKHQTIPAIEAKALLLRGLRPNFYVAMSIAASNDFITKRDAARFLNLRQQFLRKK